MKHYSKWMPLFLISSLGLFFELAAIRWVAAELYLISSYKNLPIMAAFLGLSIGFGLVRHKRDYRASFAVLFSLFVLLVLALSWVNISPSQPLMHPNPDNSLQYWLALALIMILTLAVFLLLALLFIPLGQATGMEMAQHQPLPAYIVNLIASLVGIWAYSLSSFFQTPPVFWFGLGALGYTAYLGMKRSLSRWDVPVFVATLLLLGFLGAKASWSPYQRLEVSDLLVTPPSGGEKIRIGSTIKVQQIVYQQAIDLSPEFVAEWQAEVPLLKSASLVYNLPYQVGADNGRVLILGAGSGNDVAAALRSGAGHVDAVDIDPAILALGGELHPESPYTDPRVSLIVDDARSFLQNNTLPYNMVVYGLLDSYTLLSGFSSVTLDTFVYTMQGIRQARQQLSGDGVMVLTFYTGNFPWVEQRIGRMLVQIFGEGNVYMHSEPVGTVFVMGALSPAAIAQTPFSAWQPDPAYDYLPLPTDNWPYLYLEKKALPSRYIATLILVGAACLFMVRWAFPKRAPFIWHFFWLGSAFLLVEFKSITELALLFGTTWLVNSLAISGVLLMALIANLLVLRGIKVDTRLAYGLLFASLAFAYIFPLSWLVGLPWLLRVLSSLTLLSLPLFFAGLIFSDSLKRAGEAAGPLASNLSGSVIGGALEYTAIWWGIKSLYLVAAALYVGALAAALKQRGR